MKVGIIGSGGREHAICHSLNKSKKIKKIYCFPGNAGTAEIAENIDLNLENFNELKEFILKYSIDLIIVGPEKPLVEGIVDFLENNQIKVFGPNKFASQLEGSKIFTKKLCEKYNIPTAKFGIFKNFNDAQNFLEKIEYPTVVKADNLASGKGVYICTNFNEASNAVKEIFDGKFGEAENVLIEEFLEGEEMSYFIITDGKTISKFGTAQDHKRALEGDLGKNTGGMGAYSPSRLFNKELDEKIINKIINPTIKGIEDFGSKYKGFLYAGLMIVKDEPYLIEYNVRMGDPECQTIIPKLETDLLDIFVACCDEKLREIQVKWVDQKSLCVVLCSKGYPETFEKNVVIKNFNSINLDEKDYLFHAGTKKNNNQIFATGGRVLNFVSISDNFYDAREKIHKNLESLNWENGYYRKDIGYKVID
jgi:phosphoribosylamine---glycine ligase